MLDMPCYVWHNRFMSKPLFTTAECPECRASFDRLPLEYDEDGMGCAVLEVTLCTDAACGKLLCPCCDKFACDGCGATFCADHLVSVPDGTDRPLHCCAACAAECEEVPARVPAQRELVYAAGAGSMEVA